MAEPKPFLPDLAADPFPPGTTGDFLLPICMPKPHLMLGESMAIVVLTNVEDQRVGIPMGHQALSDLRVMITEALRMLQAPEGGSVQ